MSNMDKFFTQISTHVYDCFVPFNKKTVLPNLVQTHSSMPPTNAAFFHRVCDPTPSSVGFADTVVVRALRPIKTGEMLTSGDMETALKSPEARAEFFEFIRKVVCSCESCQFIMNNRSACLEIILNGNEPATPDWESYGKGELGRHNSRHFESKEKAFSFVEEAHKLLPSSRVLVVEEVGVDSCWELLPRGELSRCFGG